MRPDSLAFINVNLPAEALPWPILAILLIGFFALSAMVIQKASAFKSYSQDFPSQTAPVVIGLGLAIATAPVVLSRMALGMKQMDGTGDWLFFVAALAGVGGAMLAVKRFSSPEYQQGKAGIEAAKAAATPPQVNVAGDASVQTSPQQVAPPTKMPQAGVKPTDANVRKGLEAMAEGIPFKGVPDDAPKSDESGGLG